MELKEKIQKEEKIITNAFIIFKTYSASISAHETENKIVQNEKKNRKHLRIKANICTISQNIPNDWAEYIATGTNT